MLSLQNRIISISILFFFLAGSTSCSIRGKELDAQVPSTQVPSTPVPNTPVPDTPVPNTPVPDTPVPDTPEPDTPEPGEEELNANEMIQVIEPNLVYEDTMEFLDEQIIEAEDFRLAFWSNLDYSSLDSYQKTIIPYREKLSDVIGLPEECVRADLPRVIKDELITTIDNIDIRYWELSVCNETLTSYALVGIPKSVPAPYPAVVALHGTCGSPERIMGLQGDDYHHSFGLELAKQGYFVYAPLISTRATTDVTQCIAPTNDERNQLDHRAIVLGERLVGIEIGKLISTLDYLSNNQLIISNRIGTYGISLGGLLSFYWGALDERLNTVVVSQYIEDQTEKLVDRDYETAYWKYENSDYTLFNDSLLYFTDVEIATMIVPRKLFIEVGSNDPRAIGSKRLLPEFQSNYTRVGLPEDYIGLEIGNGNHEIFLNGSLNFLNLWLKDVSIPKP